MIEVKEVYTQSDYDALTDDEKVGYDLFYGKRNGVSFSAVSHDFFVGFRAYSEGVTEYFAFSKGGEYLKGFKAAKGSIGEAG